MTQAIPNSAEFLGGFFVNHSLFHSTNAAETVQRCTRALGSHRMRIHGGGNGLDSTFNGVVCDDFSIVRVSHGHPVTIEPQATDEYIVHQKLAGGGFLRNDGMGIPLTVGVITVTSPGQESRYEMDSNSLNLVVRLSRKKLEKYVQDLLQRAVKRPVVFDICMEPHGPVAAAWAGAVQHVCDQYEILKRSPHMGAGVESTLVDYMIGLLLQVQPHNFSSWLTRQDDVITPYYVRKAQDYIHGNVSGHISMATLAQVTGVSARTLQSAFQRHLGRTPMEYLREQRLRCVHDELVASGPEARITEIFMKFGIYDFGRYARYYKERFGSLPSKVGRRRLTD